MIFVTLFYDTLARESTREDVAACGCEVLAEIAANDIALRSRRVTRKEDDAKRIYGIGTYCSSTGGVPSARTLKLK
ncbi:MAG: hypothetical protein NXI15_00895 [Gammaproteobacteria bacterium]|nr:hypothetical protein [Gammaproteobacteria bacterium]